VSVFQRLQALLYQIRISSNTTFGASAKPAQGAGTRSSEVGLNDCSLQSVDPYRPLPSKRPACTRLHLLHTTQQQHGPPALESCDPHPQRCKEQTPPSSTPVAGCRSQDPCKAGRYSTARSPRGDGKRDGDLYGECCI